MQIIKNTAHSKLCKACHAYFCYDQEDIQKGVVQKHPEIPYEFLPDSYMVICPGCGTRIAVKAYKVTDARKAELDKSLSGLPCPSPKIGIDKAEG